MVPSKPYTVAFPNFYLGSTHPDVRTFQAAMVKYLNPAIPITGVYDEVTAAYVAVFARKAKDEGFILAHQDAENTMVPNENFIRMVGLLVREDA